MDIAATHDYIVIGSGCTGAMAAQTLVEKGVKVLMLDAGETGNEQHIPQKSFTDIREHNKEQYQYWVGKTFEGISTGKTATGAQLTPARKFILQNTDVFLPLISCTFHPMESLSYGGLGNAWGLGCCVFSDKELDAAGLPVNKMKDAYQTIADRIGISAEKDDATPYTSDGLTNLQKPADIDNNSKSILTKYGHFKKHLNSDGFHLGKPALALLTEKKGTRETVDYNEMDFYTNNGAAYRPSLTIDELRKLPNFSYQPNAVVLNFANVDDEVVVTYLEKESREKKTIKCKKLILCSGPLSTARIVLRSLSDGNTKLPLLCNPYKYFTMLQTSMLGKVSREPRTAFAQLAMYYDPSKTNFDVSAASVYSYHSLMLFRTIKEVPLNFRDGRKIMQYLLPAISLMGVHHPDSASSGKSLEMVKDNSSVSGDKLKAEYILTEEEKKTISLRDKKFSLAMSTLGCHTLKKIDPGYGASIHYAGTLPFSEFKPYSVNREGRLNGVQNVFVADGSGFRYLPAKGITLSIMAYAHLTALNALTT